VLTFVVFFYSAIVVMSILYPLDEATPVLTSLVLCAKSSGLRRFDHVVILAFEPTAVIFSFAYSFDAPLTALVM
jgi:hypothetical protein